MRKINKIALVLVVILMVMGLVNAVYASSFKLQVNPDTTTLKAGETVTLTLKITDIDVGELGMNALEGYLEYDENIFETITQEEITGSNGWSITYNSDNGKFLGVLLTSGETEDKEVGTIKLKVKAGIEEATTTIKLKNIATNDGTNIVEETDKEVVLTVEKEEEPEPPVEEPEPDTNTEVEPPVEENEIIVDNTAPGKIPQTGEINAVLIGTSVMTVLIIAVVLYTKYRNIDR